LVEFNYISPEYFRTMGVPVRHGAVFTQADMDRASVINLKLTELYKQNPNLTSVPPELTISAIINATMARMFWPNQEPIGKTFKGGGGSIQVIGVVGDVKQSGARAVTRPQAYFPLPFNEDSSSFGAMLTVKSTGSPESVIAGIRGRLRGIDSSLAFFVPRTMDTVIAQNIQDASLETWMFGMLAALALILASVGLYSVLAYLVSQRTREIGIRMALGAQPGHVLRLIMKHALVLTTLGIALGIAGTLLTTRFMDGMLFGVTQRDPMTLFGVVGVLSLVALIACYVPARRAAHVDPLVALRYE
jgi:ABC-type antimicrobial peptide transport system permease subunit